MFLYGIGFLIIFIDTFCYIKVKSGLKNCSCNLNRCSQEILWTLPESLVTVLHASSRLRVSCCDERLTLCISKVIDDISFLVNNCIEYEFLPDLKQVVSKQRKRNLEYFYKCTKIKKTLLGLV